MLRGGGQERSRRPGTENLPGIVGLGCAADLARSGLGRDNERIGELRDHLEKTVVETIAEVSINGAGTSRTSNTTSLSFAGAEGETLTIALDLKGFAVSTGAACSSGSVEPSHVLQAMGLGTERVQGSIRVSLGKSTTRGEIDSFVVALRSAVESVRSHTRSNVLRA